MHRRFSDELYKIEVIAWMFSSFSNPRPGDNRSSIQSLPWALYVMVLRGQVSFLFGFSQICSVRNTSRFNIDKSTRELFFPMNNLSPIITCQNRTFFVYLPY